MKTDVNQKINTNTKLIIYTINFIRNLDKGIKPKHQVVINKAQLPEKLWWIIFSHILWILISNLKSKLNKIEVLRNVYFKKLHDESTTLHSYIKVLFEKKNLLQHV